MDIQISDYQDYKEIEQGLRNRTSRLQAYYRKTNQKEYAEENKALQKALKIAKLYEKCGELDMAQTVLSIASKVFIQAQLIKKVKKARNV